jgi:polysaccharide deacetylase 2 family uncharacterized protein YibQ
MKKRLLKNKIIFFVIFFTIFLSCSDKVLDKPALDEHEKSEQILLKSEEIKSIKSDSEVFKESNESSNEKSCSYLQKASFKKKRIALIIDDVGYNIPLLQKFLRTNLKLNYAVLPELKQTLKSMQLIKEYGQTLLLHLPMEPKNPVLMGKVRSDFILTEMTHREISEKMIKYLTKYDLIDGINNHMGSKATADEKTMNYLSKVIYNFNIQNNRTIFFIDSYTSAKTVVYESCKKNKVPCLESKGFIDNNNDSEIIFNELIKKFEILSDKSIVIGHNRKSTYKAVETFLNSEYFKKFTFVSLNDIFKEEGN